MITRTYTQTVNLPTIEEFRDRFPQYGNYAENEARFLYDEIISPQSFIYAMAATKMDFPAATGIAEECYQLVIDKGTIEWRGFTKQFIGAVICKLMEANGYKKTGTKKSVPHPKFTKGEVYQLAVN